jgi:hypothetical protein
VAGASSASGGQLDEVRLRFALWGRSAIIHDYIW